MDRREGYIGQCEWEQDPAVTSGALCSDGDGVVATHVSYLTPPIVARLVNSSRLALGRHESGQLRDGGRILWDSAESLR